MTFDFYRQVWANLRFKIRSILNPENSLWYKSLSAFLLVMQTRKEQVQWLYEQRYLESSSGRGVDWWGARYSLQRRPGESDELFKLRILFAKEIRRIPGTIARKKSLISILANLPIESIQIQFPYNHQFRVGDKSTLIVGSRNYIHYAYRIYIKPIAREQRQNVIQMLESVNIGGSYWEIWEELSGLSSYDTSDGQLYKGMKLSESPHGLSKYYLVY